MHYVEKIKIIDTITEYFLETNSIKGPRGFKDGAIELDLSKKINDFMKLNFNDENLENSKVENLIVNAILRTKDCIVEIEERIQNVSKTGIRGFLRLATKEKDIPILQKQKTNLEIALRNLENSQKILVKRNLNETRLEENKENFFDNEIKLSSSPLTIPVNEIRTHPGKIYLSTTLDAKAAGLIKDNSNEDRKILLFSDEKGTIHLYQWSFLIEPSKAEGLIGRGTYGVIQKLVSVGNQREVAMKLAFSQKKAIHDVYNEVTILEKIHADGIKEGILPPPLAQLPLNPPIRDQNGQTLFGYLRLFCTDNLETYNIFDAPAKEGLNMCRQLLSGAASMEKKRITIGDIKPSNILCFLGKKGMEYFHSDFGSARCLPTTTEDSLPLILDEGHTKNFVCFLDVLEYDHLELEKFEELENKREVYALGATLIMKLGLPHKEMSSIFELTHFGYSTGNFSHEGIRAKKVIIEKYGIDFWNFLEKMVHKDYTQRPIRQEAYQVFLEKYNILPD